MYRPYYDKPVKGTCFITGQENCSIYQLAGPIYVPLSEIAYAKFIIKCEQDKSYQENNKSWQKAVETAKMHDETTQQIIDNMREGRNEPGLLQIQLECAEFELEVRQMIHNKTIHQIRILKELREEENKNKD